MSIASITFGRPPESHLDRLDAGNKCLRYLNSQDLGHKVSELVGYTPGEGTLAVDRPGVGMHDFQQSSRLPFREPRYHPYSPKHVAFAQSFCSLDTARNTRNSVRNHNQHNHSPKELHKTRHFEISPPIAPL
jgi:hypothetical protein